MNTTTGNKNRIIVIGVIVLLLFAGIMLFPGLIDKDGLQDALPGAAGDGKPACADVELGTPCADKGNSGSGGGNSNSGGGGGNSSSSSSSKSNNSGGKNNDTDCSGVGIGTPCP